MFDLSFSECVVIALGALAVTKPEDIPGTARSIGKTLGKIRAWRDEWQGHIRDVADDLTRLPETPEAPSARPQAASPPPEGKIVMYRPDGSDTAYERYVEHPSPRSDMTDSDRADSALPAYGPPPPLARSPKDEAEKEEDAYPDHAYPDIETKPEDAFEAMRQAELRLQARISAAAKTTEERAKEPPAEDTLYAVHQTEQAGPADGLPEKTPDASPDADKHNAG